MFATAKQSVFSLVEVCLSTEEDLVVLRFRPTELMQQHIDFVYSGVGFRDWLIERCVRVSVDDMEHDGAGSLEGKKREKEKDVSSPAAETRKTKL
jgi:hypothetical protein